MVKKIIPFNVAIKSTYPVHSFDRPNVYTNDLNSVEIQFKVIDCTTEELETATATIQLFMGDGSFFQNPTTDVTRVGNVFSYTLKENEGNHAGIAQIQLVMIIDGTELASPLLEFGIISGLETKVATEVMIHDWTTLTRDAQAYIDQFILDEATRQQQFDDAQTARTNIFTQSEAGRATAFGEAEALRQAGYDADHSRADTDHTRAENDHTLAGQDRTAAASDRTLAGQDRTRAEADHTRAEEDHVLFADMQITHDLDTGKNYKTNLEIYNGQPRLKLEEIV